jgi:hypothetical protein
MTTRLGLALALFHAATAALADAPDVAAFVKQVEARKGKVVLDAKGAPVEVYLYNKAFSDADLALLKPFPGLKVLNLQHARITDVGVEQAVAAHPALETINIHDTLITPACVKHLAKLKALHTIEIFGQHVTDASVKLLAEMKSLTGVDLKDTRVTDKGVAELKAARPNLYVRR